MLGNLSHQTLSDKRWRTSYCAGLWLSFVQSVDTGVPLIRKAIDKYIYNAMALFPTNQSIC